MQRYVELCDILGNPPAVLTVTIPTPESRDAVRRAMRSAVDRRSDLPRIVDNMNVALHPGRQIQQQNVELAPMRTSPRNSRNADASMAPAPHEALGGRAFECERRAVFEQQRHRDAA